MNRADIARRLEKLEVLAARSPFPDERRAAQAKVKKLRDLLGIPETRSGRRVHYVDIADAPNMKAAFRKAFDVAFKDIVEQHRAADKDVGKERADAILEKFGIKMTMKVGR